MRFVPANEQSMCFSQPIGLGTLLEMCSLILAYIDDSSVTLLVIDIYCVSLVKGKYIR